MELCMVGSSGRSKVLASSIRRAGALDPHSRWASRRFGDRRSTDWTDTPCAVNVCICGQRQRKKEEGREAQDGTVVKSTPGDEWRLHAQQARGSALQRRSDRSLRGEHSWNDVSSQRGCVTPAYIAEKFPLWTSSAEESGSRWTHFCLVPLMCRCLNGLSAKDCSK